MENPKIIVCTTPSDSHMWNLVILDLFLQEKDFNVLNLGSNTPFKAVLESLDTFCPDLVIVSSLNGHLLQDGVEMMRYIQSHKGYVPCSFVAGGRASTDPKNMLFISKKLKSYGFEETFFDKNALESLNHYLFQKFSQKKLVHAV